MQLAHPITDSVNVEWDDRGRTALFGSIALNVGVAAYVIATYHVWTPMAFVFFSVLPLAASSRRSTVALRATSMCFLFLLAEIAMASVGILFMPGFVAMAVAAVRSE
jgi:hypothetical protein